MPFTSFKFRFNTGRYYRPDDHEFPRQVIDVEAVCDGVKWTVKFWDRSRGIDGAFQFPMASPESPPETIDSIREWVMTIYDTNAYEQLGWFEHLQREGKR